MLYQLGDKRVQIKGGGQYIAPNAVVIGDVVIDDQASIWFGVVIRGDNDTIHVGPKTNVQDNAVLHTDEGVKLTLGTGVTIGHQAMLHGCSVGDYSLVGINAVVLNRAVIGKYCIIGANALVPENMVIPDGSLVVGSPAKIKRSLTEQERKVLEASAHHYVHNGQRYSELLKKQDLE